MKIKIVKTRPRYESGGGLNPVLPDMYNNKDEEGNIIPYLNPSNTSYMTNPSLLTGMANQRENNDAVGYNLASIAGNIGHNINDFGFPGGIKDPGHSDVINNMPATPGYIKRTIYESGLSPIQEDNNTQEAVGDNVKRSQDGNVFDSMSMPYYMSDLQGRATMLGQSIGRLGKAKGSAGVANIAQGIFSAASLGLGLTREIMGAASEERAMASDLAGREELLARERKRSQITYQKEGGGVNIGNGQRFDSSSLTGEHIYPLPKSMEDNSNVEIEKGEYVILPDVVGPMEAKGNRHEKGGTLVDLPVAHIVSDYRKIDDKFAGYVRDNYGIKATPKDTYASLMDKYKRKIGLAQKYEDQEKVLSKLKKNQDVKDKNTSELNKSVLSKYISENQTEINDMEELFRSFADVVYDAQEKSKKTEGMNDFFREGGSIKMQDITKEAEKYGLPVSEVKELIYDEYIKQRSKMAEGGPTEKMIEANKKLSDIINKRFGRKLKMSVYDVADAGSIINPETGLNENQSMQSKKGRVYGRVNPNAYTNLLDVNRWAAPMYSNNEFKTGDFQRGYNTRLNNLWSMAEAGIISNADEAKKFRDEYGFWGEDMGKYDAGDKTAYNSFAVDDKFGQTTATRSYFGLDTVTDEQKRLLNEKGIKNYVDLFASDKTEDAKKILGDDYGKFEDIKNSGLANDLDFVLDVYDPQEPQNELKDQPNVAEVPEVPETPGTAPVNKETEEEVDDVVEDIVTRSSRPGGWNAIMPEVLRPVSGGIITKGLERYQSPRIDPVLQSADQYINEVNRATQSQLDSLGDVPDSQKAAILSNINAVTGSNIAKYITQVNLHNAQQINQADQFNENAFYQTYAQNAAERKAYQDSTLKAMAIDEENRARYYDSINDEIQKKFSVRTSLNAISSIAPNMRMLPNGQIVYVQGGNDVISAGDYSTPTLNKLEEEYDENKTKRKK